MSPELIGLLTFIAAAGGNPVHQPYTAPSYLSQQTQMLEESTRASNAEVDDYNERRAMQDQIDHLRVEQRNMQYRR